VRPENWEIFKRAARGERLGHVPLALIIDSPWIPGHLGVNHIDYYLDPDVWFESNLKVMNEFPEPIFLPSWWVEYGMAVEPSAFGAKIRFHRDKTPDCRGILKRLEDFEKSAVDPEKDGLMPFVLHQYEKLKGRIFEAGFTMPMVAARGPLCTAAHLRGLTGFLMDLMDDPEGARKIIEEATKAAISWLEAQARTIGESVEGILLLDDIVGLVGPSLYREFAHPYLMRIFGHFPDHWIKVYHNDTPEISAILEDLSLTGFHVLNLSHTVDMREAMEKTGGRVRLMGNVAPLETGVHGTPDEVKRASLKVLEKTGGRDLILSVGGGVSPEMPGENIRAMIEAVREFG